MEAVHRRRDGRVAPAVRGAVASVAREHGVLAAEALQLARQPAAVVLGRDDVVDAADDPVGPAVLAERARVGRVRALDVGLLELADVAEDPVARQLRHGLLLDVAVAQHPVGALLDAVEPGRVADVAALERHPLRVHDDDARPEDQPVVAVELRVPARHDLVEARPEVQERERLAQHADAQVVVARERRVVRHRDQDVDQPLERLRVVEVERLHPPRPVVVLVAVHLDREVRQHPQVARTAAEEGPEQLRVRRLGHLFEVALRVDDLEGYDVVPE